jgi:hypothetical protein
LLRFIVAQVVLEPASAKLGTCDVKATDGGPAAIIA